MEKIKEYIEKYDTIIIHGHIRPDGDCIGTQYGLYYLIKDNYPHKKVYITGETSEFISFIGRPALVDESLFQDALSICVDCATSDRLSDTRVNLAKEYIKIDHHIPVDDYGNYQYVDITAPACSQIITELYMMYRNEWELSKEAAQALYVGITTDTGRFKFDSVNSRTFHAAAVLLDAGVDLGYIDNKLSVESLNTLKLKGHILSNFKMTDHGFAYAKLTRKEVESFGVSYEDAAAQVSTISTIEDCPVWALFLEYSEEEIRVRLRSRGPVINLLAEQYHGGGHAKASGATLYNWDELEGFVNKADELVKKYKSAK
ncbi:MAG: bifunctional oligoribonuclease/PAP phosphatase NrnA [Acholeplasmatales bacterium]|jgi:phosphoesterase RecJ-like protein|nr:bifunctional oligoribonuclease/PAP phosphatase NrnA [Acholeplasmatales bacterium]